MMKSVDIAKLGGTNPLPRLRNSSTVWYDSVEGSGATWIDKSKNGIVGNINGATWSSYPYGLTFDAIDDYVNTDSNAVLDATSATLSYCLFANVASRGESNAGAFLSKRSGSPSEPAYSIYFDGATNRLRCKNIVPPFSIAQWTFATSLSWPQKIFICFYYDGAVGYTGYSITPFSSITWSGSSAWTGGFRAHASYRLYFGNFSGLDNTFDGTIYFASLWNNNVLSRTDFESLLKYCKRWV